MTNFFKPVWQRPVYSSEPVFVSLFFTFCYFFIFIFCLFSFSQNASCFKNLFMYSKNVTLSNYDQTYQYSHLKNYIDIQKTCMCFSKLLRMPKREHFFKRANTYILFLRSYVRVPLNKEVAGLLFFLHFFLVSLVYFIFSFSFFSFSFPFI